MKLIGDQYHIDPFPRNALPQLIGGQASLRDDEIARLDECREEIPLALRVAEANC